MSDDLQWLAQIVAGDRVIVKSYDREADMVRLVTKVTATQIVTGTKGKEVRYRKSDGHVLGGDTWHAMRLVQYTPEALDALMLTKKRILLLQTVRAITREACFRLTLVEVDALWHMLSQYGLREKGDASSIS